MYINDYLVVFGMAACFHHSVAERPVELWAQLGWTLLKLKKIEDCLEVHKWTSQLLTSFQAINKLH